MSKLYPYLFVLIFFGAYSANGQDTRKAILNVRATATVTDNLQMQTIRHLDLVNPDVVENLIKISPITSSYAGMFKIMGSPNARVRITFLRNETIEESLDEVGEIYAEYYLSAAEKDIQLQSTLLDVGEAILPIGESGELFLWLGADLDLSNATPGLYLSEFIIALEYI